MWFESIFSLLAPGAPLRQGYEGLSPSPIIPHSSSEDERRGMAPRIGYV
jgi:hypothetical protein